MTGPGVSVPANPMVVAAMLATFVVRRSAEKAFEKHHRAVTAPDVISQLGDSFYAMVDDLPGTVQ